MNSRRVALIQCDRVRRLPRRSLAAPDRVPAHLDDRRPAVRQRVPLPVPRRAARAGRPMALRPPGRRDRLGARGPVRRRTPGGHHLRVREHHPLVPRRRPPAARPRGASGARDRRVRRGRRRGHRRTGAAAGPRVPHRDRRLRGRAEPGRDDALRRLREDRLPRRPAAGRHARAARAAVRRTAGRRAGLRLPARRGVSRLGVRPVAGRRARSRDHPQPRRRRRSSGRRRRRRRAGPPARPRTEGRVPRP